MGDIIKRGNETISKMIPKGSKGWEDLKKQVDFLLWNPISQMISYLAENDDPSCDMKVKSFEVAKVFMITPINLVQIISQAEVSHFLIR